MKLKLLRIKDSGESTAGVLFLEEFPRFVTLEDTWADNAENVSCIPAGIYEIERIISPKFGETFTVNNVSDRTDIRMHWGNTSAATQGCILVGLQFGTIHGQIAIWDSRKAHEQFMEAMRGVNKAQLNICYAFSL